MNQPTTPSDDADRPHLVVSADGHAGPSLRLQLRPYCPERFLAAFDAYTEAVEQMPCNRRARGELAVDAGDIMGQSLRRAFDRTRACRGLQDPLARLADMDADGVAAEVIFAGGENGELMPFVGLGFNAGPKDEAAELRAVGGHIWNEWLSEYVSASPERLFGVMQVPIWDVDAAVREVVWGHEHGLRVVNLPAPRSDYPAYTYRSYDPFWEACADLGLTLATHAGGGEVPLGSEGPMGHAVYAAEAHWLCRRGLWQLIFGGVFERHPSLRVVFVEQRVTWVPETLRDLDSIWTGLEMLEGQLNEVALLESGEAKHQPVLLPRSPSSYWASNCFLSGSFLAPYEVARRDEVGPDNLMWGADYPHTEGTWPNTRLAMRNTFAGVPRDECRRILGELAVDVFRMDRSALRLIADRIGPRPSEVERPLDEGELPDHRGWAFRSVGAFA